MIIIGCFLFNKSLLFQISKKLTDMCKELGIIIFDVLFYLEVKKKKFLQKKNVSTNPF